MKNSKFPLEWLEFKFDLPKGIIKGVVLRDSTIDERKRIHDFWSKESSMHSYSYKYSLNEKSNKNLIISEPIDNWRYRLFDYASEKANIVFFQYALNLMVPEIELGLDIKLPMDKIKYNIFRNPLKVYNYFNKLQDFELLYLDEQYFTDVNTYYLKIVDLKQRGFVNVVGALGSYEKLKELPENSNFKILGYFTVIESLLTHNPVDPTNIDSITRQITHKIKLVNKRFSEPIDFTAKFGGISNKKLFGKLYSFRSAIAHGLNIDYDSEFQIFESASIILAFVKLLAQNVLKISVLEPELISDLKYV